MMKILVTGGAGFIGSHLVDRLVEAEHEVTVLDNLYRGRQENIQKHLQAQSIQFYQSDIRNFQEIEGHFKNLNAVFHLAAQSNVMGAVQDVDYSFYTNVVGTYNVLKACQQHNVPRLIFTSSREAYGEACYLPVGENHPLDSKNTYGASKVAGEKYCQVFQNMGALQVVILRLANVYGERDFDRVIPIFLNNVFKKQDIHIYGGQQIIDFVSVEIVVEALIQSLFNDEALAGPTNVGSGKGTTLFDLANRIMELTRAESQVVVDPPRSVEVVKFTADVTRFKQIFNVNLNDDPLYYLPKMIEILKYEQDD
ncbi:MAG: SDR family NAD(P)-dependent oxidoreductase [Caldisericaceae bacterium]|nr:SDR family NAD(P)-dependent oxidoreductase [Caldisericaceae bacterium]